MRPRNILTVILFVSLNSFGQPYTKKELKYKPLNLEEAIIQLDKMFSDTAKIKISKMGEKEFVGKNQHSSGLGMWIRNEWGLWKGKELAKYFYSNGIYQAEDMSGVILVSYHRKLTRREIDLKGQVNEINQYYENLKNPEWVKQQETNWWTKFMESYSVGDTVTTKAYFDRNLVGVAKKNTLVQAEILEKSERLIKIRIFSFGTGLSIKEVLKEVQCADSTCWTDPRKWRKAG
jgi:hypothetical protein